MLSSLLVLLTSHPHDQLGQLWLLPRASSGFLHHVPSVQIHWPDVVQVVSQQQLAVEGWEAYQPTPYYDFLYSTYYDLAPGILY